MNAQEFIAEVEQSGLAPENFRQVYEKFRSWQALAADTLMAFRDVCEKHAIPWQLAYGSLLGIVRDGGQIPWDYDVDVFVPWAYREQLARALRQDLPDRYAFYSVEADPRCRYYIMRLFPKGYREDVLHVDVFFYIGAPEEEPERTAFGQEVIALANRRKFRLMKPLRLCYGRARSFARLWLQKLGALTVSVEKTDRAYRQLCRKYDWQTARYCVSADVFANWAHFPGELLRQTLLTDTCWGPMRLPREYDRMLRLCYGEYARLQPLQKRLKEMLYHYDLLERFAKE